MFRLRSSEYATRISLGLMISVGVLSATSCRLIFGEAVIALRLTGKIVALCQVKANESYSEAKWQLCDRKRDVQSLHKWWPTLKSAVFGSSSSLPPLVGGAGGLVCESVDKTERFDSKQSRESVDLPFTFHPSHSFTTFAFRQSDVKRLLLDLGPCVTDPLGMFPFFHMRPADVMAPRL